MVTSTYCSMAARVVLDNLLPSRHSSQLRRGHGADDPEVSSAITGQVWKEADATLPDYDATAARRTWQRALAFLNAL
jgi:hypothetical protein